MRKMRIAAKQSGMIQFLQKGSEPLCMYAYHLECGESGKVAPLLVAVG